MSATSETAVASPTPHHKVHALAGWRRILLWPLGFAVRWWGRSLHFETTPRTRRNLEKLDEPVAFVLWHNRLFLVAEVFRRYRRNHPIYGLVSASKDGAWLDAFFSLVGIRTVRGSSSKLGREAALALVDVLRRGDDIGITPDGPRGPLYDFKAGSLIVTRRAHAPILLLGGVFEKAWQLRSWDRFYLPHPFSRVRIHCDLIRPEELADRSAAAESLKLRLLAISSDGHQPPEPPVI